MEKREREAKKGHRHCESSLNLQYVHVILTFSSFVRWYVTMVVREEKRGARNTQTLRMSMVMLKKCTV